MESASMQAPPPKENDDSKTISLNPKDLFKNTPVIITTVVIFLVIGIVLIVVGTKKRKNKYNLPPSNDDV